MSENSSVFFLLILGFNGIIVLYFFGGNIYDKKTFNLIACRRYGSLCGRMQHKLGRPFIV